MTGNAIGVVENNFYSNSVVILDEMLKASQIGLAGFHTKLGGRMVHTIICGSTSDVSAAMEAAQKTRQRIGKENLKAAITISNPHPEVWKLMNLLIEQK